MTQSELGDLQGKPAETADATDKGQLAMEYRMSCSFNVYMRAMAVARSVKIRKLITGATRKMSTSQVANTNRQLAMIRIMLSITPQSSSLGVVMIDFVAS